MKKSYRKNVAIVVFNHKKELLVCERLFLDGAWQFPQGALDIDETIEAAAFRELYEETSIKSVKKIKIIEEPIIYDFPDNIREKLWKNPKNEKFYGQEQYWALMYFYGEDKEINIRTENPEFKSFAWESYEFILNNIVYFKKNSYEKALKALKPYIEEYIFT